MNPRELPAKIDAVERAGWRGLGRHLRRTALSHGIPVAPPAPRAVELPALKGFSAADLDGLGIPHRTRDGRLVVVAAARGGKP